MTPEELVTHKFPDTSVGAIAYLVAETQEAMDCSACLALPDPFVNGVWEVRTPNDSAVEFCIVYLAGYMMPNGEIRKTNDFESFYRDER